MWDVCRAIPSKDAEILAEPPSSGRRKLVKSHCLKSWGSCIFGEAKQENQRNCGHQKPFPIQEVSA